MNTRMIIRKSRNETPEQEITEAIAPLIAEGFRVVSATTALAPYGVMEGGLHNVDSALHVYYVTTVVLEKS